MKSTRSSLFLTVLVALVIVLMNVSVVSATPGTVYSSYPAIVDSSASYVIYLHGSIIESSGGLPASSSYDVTGDGVPETIDYRFVAITDAIAAKGYNVIAEIRSGVTDITVYSTHVASQVDRLIADGVPAENITVMGFSKGGAMALVVSSLVADASVNYVVEGGCGLTGSIYEATYRSIVSTYGASLQGRMLSVYDSVDTSGGTCQLAFNAAPAAGFTGSEIVLNTGWGHAIFYQPKIAWIIAVFNWL